MTQNVAASVHHRLLNRARAEGVMLAGAIQATFHQRQTAILASPVTFSLG